MRPTSSGFQIEKEAELEMLGHDVLEFSETAKGANKLPARNHAILAALCREDVLADGETIQWLADSDSLLELIDRLAGRYLELIQAEDRGNAWENASKGYNLISRYLSILNEARDNVVEAILDTYSIERSSD